jgi:hypothetical protein
MTPAERLAARIAKNREIEQRVLDKTPPAGSPAASRRSKSVVAPARSGNNPLDRFQEIKRTEGIDAASDYVHSRIKPRDAN